MANTRRQIATKKILDMVKFFDKTNFSYKRWAAHLHSLNDKEFDDMMKLMRDSPHGEGICIEVDYSARSYPEMHEMIKKAKEWKIPIEEHIIMPGHGNKITEKVPVIDVLLKALKQLGAEKNNNAMAVKDINPGTGQVTDRSKASRFTAIQVAIARSVGLTSTINEFLGPRGDDNVASSQMTKQILETGQFKMSDVKTEPLNRKALNYNLAMLRQAGFYPALPTLEEIDEMHERLDPTK